MESAKIEGLLEAYFEGNTTLAEEAQIRAYFRQEKVAPQLKQYEPLFAGIEASRREVSQREIVIPKKSAVKTKVWWYGIAASAVVGLIVANFMFSGATMTQDQEEALAALKESKKTMLLLSENLNKGAGKLVLVNEFTETKNRILK
jgi:hypothetical protein